MSHKLSPLRCNKFVMKVNRLAIFISYLLVVKPTFVMREETPLNSNKTIKNASTEINKYHPPVYTLNEHLFYIC